MKPNFICKMISAVVLGMLFGTYIHHDYAKWAQRGCEAFLAYQTHRFELHMQNPRPAMVTVVGATLVIAGFLAIYEILALALGRVLQDSSGDQIVR